MPDFSRFASAEPDEVIKLVDSSLNGLTAAQSEIRLKEDGRNEVAVEHKATPLTFIIDNLKNPLNLLLIALATLSTLTKDYEAAIIILIMVLLGSVLRFTQEYRASKAASKLKAMVSSKATALRDGADAEIDLADLVKGDIVRLAAGDMIPADLRILVAKDLFINQVALTGEALPVEKRGLKLDTLPANPLEIENLCFLGSSVVSGTALGLVISTGESTYFGNLALRLVEKPVTTSFDKGINSMTWLMIRFMIILVPLVFVINGFSKGNWLEAFLFSMAVAVGLTPEMMPMIVSVNLSKGAMSMAKKKVIVKQLAAIQNFGAMDVLCTDKTGTITEGKIVLEKYLDLNGQDSDRVLNMAFLNSFHHTGLKNITDEAILNHGGFDVKFDQRFRKIDEIPFDFNRKRMSVILEDETGLNILIAKGASKEIFDCCDQVEIDGQLQQINESTRSVAIELIKSYNAQGFREVVLAYKEMPGAPDEPVYSVKDESGLVLLGFLFFFDPPKKSTMSALKQLSALSVDVKILTGDNDVVTRYICEQVGLPVNEILLGPAIEAMDDQQLKEAVTTINIFAKLAPHHKQRVIKALQSKDHIVGFMGDGINDAPALKVADVGISVNSAADIAKESSSIILLESDLEVLSEGVKEGRRVFGNIIKYVKMAASSNFGNMFSVVGASAFLPFLPMLPIQVLTNNLLYDFSQTTIPTDTIDQEWMVKPRHWDMHAIQNFILVIGPISSIFDYLTFFVMITVFKALNDPALFHTGWFIESIFTQTLIIHVIRTNRIPFLQSKASWPLIISSIVIVAFASWLTVSPFASALGFKALPPLYWLILAMMLLGYLILTQFVKVWFNRKFKQT